MRRFCLALLLASVLSVSALAQSLTVTNYLNPDGLPARDALTAISGVTFADSEALEYLNPPTTLNGVSVWVDGVPQRIRAVFPDQVVFVLSHRRPRGSELTVRTQSGAEYNTTFAALDVWPAVQIAGDAETETGFNYVPLALYSIGGQILPVGVDPIPVGPGSNPTIVLLHGSGFRNSRLVGVRLNGIPCRVISNGPFVLAGMDTIAFEIPAYLAGNGAMDVTVHYGSRISNFARIYLGDSRQ